MSESDYEFTVDWFSRTAAVWDSILQQLKPLRILEIGSYEGRSACYMIDKCAQYGALEIHCVDTWEGGVENQPGGSAEADMRAVEARFDKNVKAAKSGRPHEVTVVKHKETGWRACARLICEGRQNYFDLVYVDGSHQASDVLEDAVASFRLLRVGGVMIFDDYLWSMEQKGKEDPLNMPKPAIDAFMNIFQRKMHAMAGAMLYQLYTIKHSD